MTKTKTCLIILSASGIFIILCTLWLGMILLRAYSLMTHVTPVPTVGIEDALDRELASEQRIRYNGSRTEGDTLVIRVTLPRDELVEFWDCVNMIHRRVARFDPPVYWVTIEDTGGQRISVRAGDLRDYHFGRITWARFRAGWRITNP